MNENALIRYTNKDFDSIKENILENIPRLTQDWTDFSESDLGMVLVNLFCGIGDMLSYYIDKKALDTNLMTTKVRSTAENLCEQLDYRIKRAIGAEVELTFTPDTEIIEDIVIPAYTVCSTIGGTKFITTEKVVLRPTDESVNVHAIQGELIQETFQATGEDVQEYQLTRQNIAENLFDVTVNGVPWKEEDKDEFKDISTNVYMLKTDYSNYGTLKFNTSIGSVPIKDQNILVVYASTDGLYGNTKKGLITKIESVFTGSSMIKVENLVDAKYGRDRETIEEAKYNAPRSLRTMNRAITADDYEILATSINGVDKAKVVNESNWWRAVSVYIASDTGEVIEQELKDKVKNFLLERNEITVDVEVKDAIYVPVSVELNVYLKNMYSRAEVKGNVDYAIRERFSPSKMTFGGGVIGEQESIGMQLGDVYTTVESIDGVRYCDILKFCKNGGNTVSNLEFDEREIPKIDSIIVNLIGGI